MLNKTTDYQELTKMGYSPAQINQMLILEDNILTAKLDRSLTEYINPKTEITDLRKLVEGLKNKNIDSLTKYVIALSLLSSGARFDILTDNKLEDDVIPYINAIILNADPSELDTIINTALLEPFNNIYNLSLIAGDVKNHVDVKWYLNPNFSEFQWTACRDSLLRGCFEYRDIIEKMNPKNCHISIIDRAKEIDMADEDIIKLSYDIPADNIYVALDSIRYGYNLLDILKDDLLEPCLLFINGTIKRNVSEKTIREYWEKYDEDILRIIGFTASKIGGKDSLEKLLASIKNDSYENYEINMMNIAAKNYDIGLLAVLINNSSPDITIYKTLEDLKNSDVALFDSKSLGRIFYDKQVRDVYNYEPNFRLSNEQVMVLASAYSKSLISECTLDLIRDINIEPEVMNCLCKLSNKRINITPYIDIACETKKEDAEKLYNKIYNENTGKNIENIDYDER